MTAGKVINPNSASTAITMDSNYTIIANFATDVYTISGHILEDDEQTPVGGVQVQASNSGGSDLTDANGLYGVVVPYDWSGTVTPSQSDETFIPANMVYSGVLSDMQDQNYLAVYIYDLDRDCLVSTGDLIRIAENWLLMPAGLEEGDFNEDTIVNLSDFALFAQHWLEGN